MKMLILFSLADASSPKTANGGPKKKVAGKVVFGGGNRLLEKKAAEANQKPGAAPKPQPERQKEEEEEPSPAFKAFTGKGRSLKD